MAEGEHTGKPEGKAQKGLEILDLKNHGALYGRFLLASQAKTAGEAANIINPAITLEHPRVRYKQEGNKFFLKDRDYNPVFENFSLAERKEEWKDFAPSTTHPTAYSQWRTEFTRFMVNIQDPKRALALKTILANNKEAKEFTVDDADTLFNEFCEGKSDITHFITRVTANLVSDGKINPTNLQELLPHLQWIASGLFGKNTSSDVVTRLIELESALHNDPQAISKNLNLNKERINTPTDDEKRVLGLLHKSLPVPQEKRNPIKVAAITIPVATSGKVISKPDEGKDEDALPVAPQVTEAAAPKDTEPPAHFVPTQEWQEVPPGTMLPTGLEIRVDLPTGKSYARIDAEAAAKNARLEAKTKMPVSQSAEVAEETENAKIDILPIPGGESEFDRMVNLSINGEKSEIIWRQSKDYVNERGGERVWEENIFWFVSAKEAEGSLKIPRGIGLYINTHFVHMEPVFITGGKGAEVSIDDLKEIEKNSPVSSPIILHVKGPKKAGIFRTEGKAHLDYSRKEVTVEEAITRIRKDLEKSETNRVLSPAVAPEVSKSDGTLDESIVPAEAVGSRADQKIASTENITENIRDMESVKPADFPEKLNKYLTQNESVFHAAVSVPPDLLQKYIAFMAKGYKVRTGTIEVDRNNNRITIRGVRISKLSIGATLDLIIYNNDVGEGIVVEIQKYQPDFLARRSTSQVDVENQLKTINSTIRKHLDEQIVHDNPLWKTRNVSIAEGRVLIQFKKNTP